jgi:hypothetical protein
LKVVGHDLLHFRVRDVEPTAEFVDPAEYDVFLADVQVFFQPLDRLKPDQFEGARVVADGGYHALGPTVAQDFHAPKDAAELDLLAFRLDVANAVEAGAVDVSEREMVQEVSIGEYAQIKFERLRALRTDAFEIFYGGIEWQVLVLQPGYHCAPQK